ncbi:hypothetical protein FTX61_21770 [Nitriliruptoraceae bacterium ZYF776]|nr:hypothetical protein [Profundirhabdus halotolerans]
MSTVEIEPGTRTTPLVTTPSRVRMADTDAAKLIFFGCVFRWSDVLFTDFFAATGKPLSRHFADGVGFPAVRTESEYRYPLGLDDEIELELWTGHIGERSFSLVTRVFVDVHGERREAVRARVWHTYVEMRPGQDRDAPEVTTAPLPDWLRAALS